MAKEKMYTKSGYAALLEEKRRVEEAIEKNKKDISTARSFGDLSENSEYDEAKREQGIIASRIAELEDLIHNAQVLDPNEIDKNLAGVGATVKVRRLDNGRETEYQLVGSFGADPQHGKISDESPIGMAIKGQRVGATVEVLTPSGMTFKLEILSIEHDQ